MKWLIPIVLVVASVVVFMYFFRTTTQTVQGDRFTFCDAMWHEYTFHDKALPEMCENTTTLYRNSELRGNR